MNDYTECALCPRRCGVDRTKATGYCGMGDKLLAARASLHMWEEPCISGERGSGTVFFSGCNLGCIYCQNSEIANGHKGVEITSARLAEIFIEQQQRGAHNINLVTPTHFVPHIIEALDAVRGKRLHIPIVYNCGGYESIKTLRMLEGYVDIYLPDFKYADAALARKYSNAPDYPDAAKKALAEMARQTGECEFDADGMMLRGMIVRHLVLPSHTENSLRAVEYLYRTFGTSIYMSIMNQYTPMKAAGKFPELARRVSSEEYDAVIDFAAELGVENAFVQEGGTVSESFIPLFDGSGIL